MGAGTVNAETRRRFLIGTGLVLVGSGMGGAALARLPDPQIAGVSAGRIDLEGSSEAVQRLYGGSGQPLWSERSARAFELAIGGAGAHGLDPQPYLALIDSSPSTGDRDLNRSRAALAYARALAVGLVDPAELFDIYTLARDAPDLVEGLRGALSQERVAEWLEGLAPQDAQYLALSAAYIDLSGQSGGAQATPITGGPPIRPGDRDRRRPAVLAALARERAMAPSQSTGSLVWTMADADLLKTYQRSRGLAEDGIVGPNTLALINASSGDKARRLAVNLERLRWLQRRPPPTRIDVNTAASTMAYIVDDQIVWTTVVVTGSPGHETPQLQAGFSRLVVNPPWYVPASIARREITPRGPAYLARNHMRRVSGRIIQAPGPWAALGQVKFDMQNPYAIYLHDTPAKAVFSRSQRHRSHGCIRVKDAVSFARRLARESGNRASFDRTLESGRTGVVALAAEIPVRLIYQTALVDEDGTVTFRPDVYGWDVRTAQAMGLTPPDQTGIEAITAAPLGP
jgi:murein L,D-transpeptidase YcbB/YkuD